jgi:D-alanyl-D-alanine carboxypeptidase
MRLSILTSAAVLLLAASPAAAEDVPITPSPTPSAAQGVEIPDFATASWIVADANSGDVLAGQNIDEQRPMASTIKTLTALTLLPRLDHDSTYEGSARETLTEGMHVGVLAGNRYTVRQLFHGMMMRSGNDAAVALADAYGYQRTLDAMNAEARRVGAQSTVAMSPNGLDRPGQVTTAADLAQIFRVAIADPRLQEIMTTREFEFPATPPSNPTLPANTFTIFNNDNLLNSGYPGFLGGKSGFTSQAGRTYVAGADRDGRRLVVALLGIGGGTTQTARQVLDWSYANVDRLTPIGQLPPVPEPEQLTPEPAGSNASPDDVAPLPPDPQLQQQAQLIAERATAVARQVSASLPEPITADVAAQNAQTAVAAAVQQSGVTPATPVDTTVVAQTAQQAAAQAVTAAGGTPRTPTTSGLGADMLVAGLTTPPFVAAEPAPPAPERGLFATLLVGLLKALMWLLLFLGIAVVLLRVRAVRRQRQRRAAREAAMRQRAAGSPAADPTRHRVPSRTG